MFFFISNSCRARRPVEVCPALPELHLQGQGSPAGSLFAGPLPGHGGCHGSGGGALSGVHRVGKSGEEDLPQTGAGGETSARPKLAIKCTTKNKLHRAHLDIHLDFYHLDHSLSSLKLKNDIFLPLNVPFETYPVVSALDTTWCLFE